MIKAFLELFLLLVTVITTNFDADETGLCVTQSVCPKARQGYGICCIPRNNVTYLNYCLACNDVIVFLM